MYNLLRDLALSFLLIFLSLIFFPGCSSTYVQEQYPSKKEFYRKINSECSNRTVNLNFAADSSVSSNITVVSVDSIHWKSFTTDTSFRIIPLTNIKDISYSKVRLKNFDGVLTLKDDSLLHVVNSVYRKNDISAAVTTTIKHGYSAPIN